MTTEQKHILKQIDALNVWQRHNERAPHKPLLILLALAQIQHKQDRLILFQDLEQPLKRLLKDFGPPRQSIHPEYPFWRLQNDDLWEVTADALLECRKGNTDAKKSELIAKQARGGFPETVYRVFLSNSRFDCKGKK